MGCVIVNRAYLCRTSYIIAKENCASKKEVAIKLSVKIAEMLKLK